MLVAAGCSAQGASDSELYADQTMEQDSDALGRRPVYRTRTIVSQGLLGNYEILKDAAGNGIYDGNGPLRHTVQDEARIVKRGSAYVVEFPWLQTRRRSGSPSVDAYARIYQSGNSLLFTTGSLLEDHAGWCDDPGCTDYTSIRGVIYPVQKGGAWVPQIKLFHTVEAFYPDEDWDGNLEYEPGTYETISRLGKV